jgi:alpha-tubulin suppressor-like RCC1 family protein
MVSSGSSGGPGTPTNLQLINQGGPNNSSAPLTNYQQIRWVAAAQGAYPISHYQIYRNGVAYDTTTNTSYTDSNAPGSNDPTWTTPAKTYAYQVAAVDTQGNIGPQAAQMSVYSYQNGESNWGNSDLSWGTLNENYASTAGNPQGGPTDVSVDFISGGFQPTANTPQSPQWDLEIGAFNYFTIDVNPGPTTAYVLNLGAVSRVPPGDVYGWHPAVNVFDYGPAPVANTWASYKIPLTDLGMGTCQFTGSISGTTLTVTRITSGPPLVDNAGFVTGPGVPAGTYIISSAQNSAVGAFTVAGPGISSSTSVPTTTMAYQRTSLYKFAVFPSVEPTQMYFNNMGWTTSASATSPAPTATLSASPTTVASGASSNLSWSSTNATSCAASGGWTGTEATSGTFTVSPTNTTTYTLTCTGAGGTSAPANVTVTVAPAPTVTLTAIPTSITSGSNSTLTWSSKNATSCAASGGWTGTEATNGTQSVSPIATTTYSLTCTGEGGTTSPASATVTVTSASPGLTKVGTGEYEIYYLIDGTIYGYGSPGLLGLGNNPTEIAIPPAPIATPSGLKFIDVQGGMHQSLALDQNGHVWTWGDAADGRAGDGQNHASLVNTTPYMITQDNQGNDFGDVIAVYASYVFDAAIKSDGTVWVWGDCTAADTGDGTTGAIVTSPTRVPLSLPGGVKITQLGVGDGIFALASDGTVWAWGQSENVDDLGTGNPDYENPHQVAGLPSNIKQIAWGAGHYALTTDGELYGWGYRGAYLGIGDGVNTWQPTPTAISLTTILELPAPVAFVVSSSLTTHVILTDGSLWGWGSAGNGGIGDGQEPDWATANPPYAWDWGAYDMMVMKPVRIVPSVSNFKAIFANSTYDFYIYALTTDGKLFSWGRNKTGVLGNGVYPMAANGNFGTASNIAATYPNSWDVSTATEVTPMTTKGIPTNSPYCVANPNAADCF